MAKQNLEKRKKPVKKMQPIERFPARTQKANMGGNAADKALGNLMSGNVLPSHGKSIQAPTISNKDRRNK